MENREKMLKEKLTHGKTIINKDQKNRQLKLAGGFALL